MNEDKNLEEAIKRLKQLIEARKRRCRFIDFDTCICGTKDLETVLQALENSIPKKKIKSEIEILKAQCGGNVFHIQQTLNAEIRLLQELLEDK